MSKMEDAYNDMADLYGEEKKMVQAQRYELYDLAGQVAALENVIKIILNTTLEKQNEY